MTFDEAKSKLKFIENNHPDEFQLIGGQNITDSKIEEALEITSIVVGAITNSEEDQFKKELTRLCK